MSAAYLYSLAGCDACQRARALLEQRGYEVREIAIDNPLMELGVKLLFRDNQVHAPVAAIPGDGFYVLSQDAEPQLLRLVSLEG